LDRFFHFGLQLQECRIDLLGGAAGLVDGEDALLKVDTRFECPKYVVTGAEDA
jgi:hypothetical protein